MQTSFRTKTGLSQVVSFVGPRLTVAALMKIIFTAGPTARAAVTLEATVQAGFKAAFAERDITSDIGMEASGNYRKSYHRTFHDPCKVRAVVFDDGKQHVALVGVDLLFLTRHVVTEEVRRFRGAAVIPYGQNIHAAFREKKLEQTTEPFSAVH